MPFSNLSRSLSVRLSLSGLDIEWGRPFEWGPVSSGMGFQAKFGPLFRLPLFTLLAKANLNSISLTIVLISHVRNCQGYQLVTNAQSNRPKDHVKNNPNQTVAIISASVQPRCPPLVVLI